jgi:hypothetical protein
VQTVPNRSKPNPQPVADSTGERTPFWEMLAARQSRVAGDCARSSAAFEYTTTLVAESPSPAPALSVMPLVAILPDSATFQSDHLTFHSLYSLYSAIFAKKWFWEEKTRKFQVKYRNQTVLD